MITYAFKNISRTLALGLSIIFIITAVPAQAGWVTVSPALPTTADQISLKITGTTPTPCYSTSATVQRNGSDITVDVVSVDNLPPGGACIQIIGSFLVSADLGMLPSGDYRYIVRTFLGDRLGNTAVGAFFVYSTKSNALINGSFEDSTPTIAGWVGWGVTGFQRLNSETDTRGGIHAPTDGRWMMGIDIPPTISTVTSGSLSQSFVFPAGANVLLTFDRNLIDPVFGPGSFGEVSDPLKALILEIVLRDQAGRIKQVSVPPPTAANRWEPATVLLNEIPGFGYIPGYEYILSIQVAPNYNGVFCITTPCPPGSFGSGTLLIDNVVLAPARTPNIEPVANDLAIATDTTGSVAWAPRVSDSNGDLLTCRIGTLPSNGTATIASNCSSGTYQAAAGFIGIDSFTYIANDGQVDSKPGTVTVATTEPPAGDRCLEQYPVSSFSQTGKAGTLTISFTGNIVSHTSKAVKVCPGTTLSYNATSTQGSVTCRVRHNTASGSGTLRINNEIKCADKPAGRDKIQVKVKSGVK